MIIHIVIIVTGLLALRAAREVEQTAAAAVPAL
jgi:hypothetical protein